MPGRSAALQADTHAAPNEHPHRASDSTDRGPAVSKSKQLRGRRSASEAVEKIAARQKTRFLAKWRLSVSGGADPLSGVRGAENWPGDTQRWSWFCGSLPPFRTAALVGDLVPPPAPGCATPDALSQSRPPRSPRPTGHAPSAAAGHTPQKGDWARLATIHADEQASCTERRRSRAGPSRRRLSLRPLILQQHSICEI